MTDGATQTITANVRRSFSPRSPLGWLVIALFAVVAFIIFVEVVNVLFYDPFQEERFLFSLQSSLSDISISWLSIIMFGSLLIFLMAGMPLAFVTGSLAVVFMYLIGDQYMLNIIPGRIFPTMTNYQLSAIPLFIFMASMLERAGLIDEMFDVIYKWLGGVRGGLASAAIIASTILAAMVGIIAAAIVTMGIIALPSMLKRNYDHNIALGSIMAGGTLGILIPPSINMIIYAVMTNTSLPSLYLAGILPGLLLAGLFMALIAAACLLNPRWGGQRIETSWRARLTSLPHLLPPAAIFAVVVGSIYAGFATPTEAAALGVIAALILAALFRALTLPVLLTAFEGTMRTTAMIILIIIAAYFLNLVFAAIGLAAAMEHFVTTLGLGPYQTILVIAAFYIVLGCFMETLSMMIATVPIVTPIVVSLGFDPVWFGIVLMLLLETALVTPPIGLNLFVVQSIRPVRGSMNDVMAGAMPFVGMLLVMIGLVIAVPDIALWLPGLLR